MRQLDKTRKDKPIGMQKFPFCFRRMTLSKIVLLLHLVSSSLEVDFDKDIHPHEWSKFDIDYNSCDHGFYDEADYYYQEDACHRSNFPEETLEEKFFEGVKQCCDLHGYIQKGRCNSKVCRS